MKLIKKITILALINLSFFANSNEIALSKSIITFENNENRKVTLDILNLKKENTSYVETNVREVLNPELGMKSELYVHKSPKEAGIFVTPNKQIIKSGTDRGLLSVINVNQNLEKERVYRVDVKPVISGIDGAELDGPVVKVLLAYDILIYVQPDVPVMDFDYEFEANSLLLKNTGNTHFTLDNGLACQSEDKCTALVGGNLFSGSVGEIKIEPLVKYVTYDFKMKGKKTKQMKFER